MPASEPRYQYSEGVKQPASFWRHYLLLFGILVLAAVLRCYGIRWGLPDTSHPAYTYHPDEALHLIIARYLAEGKMINKTFIYGGTFYFTILNSFYYFAGLLDSWLAGINRLADTVLLGRYAHTAVALLTILMVYQCGRMLFGRTTGLLAALMLSLMPAHIVYAQRLRPDEIGAFFVTLLLLLSCWILKADSEKNLKFCLYAGIAAGMAIAFRFPLAVFMLAPVCAHFFVNRAIDGKTGFQAQWYRKLALMIGCTALGYAIASPHTFLYFGNFMQGLAVQWSYQSGTFADSIGNGPAIYQWGGYMLREGLGYPLYFLALGGITLAVMRRSQADILILLPGAIYFVMTSFTSWVVVRYVLPLLPLLALLAGSFVKYAGDSFPRYRYGIYATFSLAMVLMLLANYAYLRIEAGRDVRDIAAEWIQKNIPHGSSILVVRTYTEDLYFNPVIAGDYTVTAFHLTEKSDGKELFRDHQFDYLVLHELLYKNMERLGARHPEPHARVFHESLLNSSYRRYHEFKKPISILGLDFSSWFSSQDYLVANPAIRIYKYLPD